MYGYTDGRRDRSVALEKVRGTGLASSVRWMVAWRVAHLVTGGRECREGSSGDCAAPSRRRSSSRPAESTRWGIGFLSFSLFLLFHLFSLASSLVNPLVLFRFAITAIFVHPLHRITCLASTSPFLPLILFSFPLATLSHPVSPTMLPVSLSRPVALQKQAYGYPQ